MWQEGLNIIKVDENQEVYVLGGNQVLMEGDYEDRHFAIVRHELGFPDAYVEIKEDDWIYKADIDEECGEQRYYVYQGRVHGGATFYGKCYWNEDDDRFYLGWDYAHAGDYQEYHPYSGRNPYENDKNKKWTLAEILMQIAGVIADIRWQNDNHWEELHALPVERDGT